MRSARFPGHSQLTGQLPQIGPRARVHRMPDGLVRCHHVFGLKHNAQALRPGQLLPAAQHAGPVRYPVANRP